MQPVNPFNRFTESTVPLEAYPTLLFPDGDRETWDLLRERVSQQSGSEPNCQGPERFNARGGRERPAPKGADVVVD